MIIAGDGSAALSANATAVFVDEHTTGGAGAPIYANRSRRQSTPLDG
jgi:hypothetical protein